MNELKLQAITLDSREVAQMIGKRHDHLIRDIQKYIEYLTAPNFGLNEFFLKSTYKDSIGRTLPCYEITKKGCELIAHKMTGQKGVQFTAEYINRFHEMEKGLSGQYTQQQIDEPYTYTDKYWQGKQVLTLRDIEHFTGIPHTTISYQLRHSSTFREGVDYFFLQNDMLYQYKVDNRHCNKFANSLYLVTKSGCMKLAKIFSSMKDKIPPLEQSDKIIGVELKSLKIVDYVLKDASRSADAVKEYIELLNKPLTREYVQRGKETIREHFNVLTECLNVLLAIEIEPDYQVVLY